MTRPDDDRNLASPDDDRHWRAFALAAGFEDELRELAAAGEDVGATDEETDLDGPTLLAADRLHALLELDRSTRSPVEPASRNEDRPSKRRLAWVAPALIALAGVAAAVSATVWLRSSMIATDEVAYVQRLAEEWAAVRDEWSDEQVAVDDSDFAAAAEELARAESPVEPPTSDEALFDETPDWLVYVVARKAQVAGEANLAPLVEEATP